VKNFALAIVCSSLAFALPAQAQEEHNYNYLSLGAGIYDVGDDDEAADFRIEYRDGKPLFWQIKPWFGAEFTSDASIWAGGGLITDIHVGPNVYFTPSFGVGLYGQGSSDLDLGYPIEFRSQIEAGYEFNNGHRLGAAFGHISNASLDDKNPGTEILNLYYHVPVGSLFRDE